jgi:hypothetical protein
MYSSSRVIDPACRVTPLPLALSTAMPSSREPPEPVANCRPARELPSISTTGGPPLTYAGADLAPMDTLLAMAGSRLARVITPPTRKSMTADFPGEPALALLMAARSEPAPEFLRFGHGDGPRGCPGRRLCHRRHPGRGRGGRNRDGRRDGCGNAGGTSDPDQAFRPERTGLP